MHLSDALDWRWIADAAVEQSDAIAARNERAGEMSPDKARSADDQNVHELRFIRREVDGRRPLELEVSPLGLVHEAPDSARVVVPAVFRAEVLLEHREIFEVLIE